MGIPSDSEPGNQRPHFDETNTRGRFAMKKSVVISGHPDLHGKSIANRIIIEAVRGLNGVGVRELHGLYPDFRIDVASEQMALVQAERIVLQFPFYWYSVPGILKEWMDQVLVYGFAYGTEGTKLKGKEFVVSTTVGGPESSYRSDGFNTYTIDELLYPLKQTANLCGMSFAPPLVSHDMIYIPGVYNVKEEVEERARLHANRLVELLTS